MPLPLRLRVRRVLGPPILTTPQPSAAVPLNAYQLDELQAAVTFTGGTHILTATHALTTVKANITFTGGSHTLTASHALTTIKANVAFAGGTHTLAAQHSLTQVKANITFQGGTHTLTYTPGAAAYSLAEIAPALTFTGGTHVLHWSGETLPVEQGGSRAVRPQETLQLRHYRLWHEAADIRLVGGIHELIHDNSQTLDDEEALLLAL